MKTLELLDIDRRIWEEELEAFVPEKVFDVHTHLWTEKYKGANKDVNSMLRLEVDMAELKRVSELVYPGRQIDFVAMGTPLRDIDLDGHNAWIAEEVGKEKKSYGGMIVTPSMAPSHLEAQIKKYNFKILKPYRTFADNMTDCRIKDYFPEALMEVADSLGMGIVMHLSRKTGADDIYNLNDLQAYTKKYPRIQWILAHCARAFNPFTLEKSIYKLRDMPNIWYDTSAVNDLYSHILLLKHENRKRIMFGSDNVAAGCMRGKYITYGYAWEGYKGNYLLEHCESTATLVIYEQLRAQRQASVLLELSRTDIEDLFYRNAENFFKLLKGTHE